MNAVPNSISQIQTLSCEAKDLPQNHTLSPVNKVSNYFSQSHLFITFQHLFAGGMSAAISRSAISPIERLIILRQTAHPGYRTKSIIDSFRHIWHTDGLKGMFYGNGTNLLRIIPYSAIELSTFEFYKHYVSLYTESSQNNQQQIYFLSGALAGITATMLVYPLDLTHTILAYQKSHNGNMQLLRNQHISSSNKQSLDDIGIGNTLKFLKSHYGIRGCYKGLLLTCSGIAPYVSIKLAVYQLLKNQNDTFYLDNAGQISTTSQRQRQLSYLISGAVSGTVAVSIMYPIDLIRRKIQIASLSSTLENQKNSPKFRSAISEIYSTTGIKGFYTGLGITYLKIIPSAAITFMLNEQFKSLFRVVE